MLIGECRIFPGKQLTCAPESSTSQYGNAINDKHFARVNASIWPAVFNIAQKPGGQGNTLSGKQGVFMVEEG